MGIGESNLKKKFSSFNLEVKRGSRAQNLLKVKFQKISVILNSLLLWFGILWQTKLNLTISFRCTQNAQQTGQIHCKANSVAVLLSKFHCGQWKANCEFERTLACNPNSCTGNVLRDYLSSHLPGGSKGMTGNSRRCLRDLDIGAQYGVGSVTAGENLLLERERYMAQVSDLKLHLEECEKKFRRFL